MAGIGTELIPSVVLLTSWENKKLSPLDLKKLISSLVDKGTNYFVCLGDGSEQLHDEIDELLLEYDELNNSHNGESIITTFHTDETVDDGIFFFTTVTEYSYKRDEVLLAILENDIQSDLKIKELLEKV